jgi:hypothetical protein
MGTPVNRKWGIFPRKRQVIDLILMNQVLQLACPPCLAHRTIQGMMPQKKMKLKFTSLDNGRCMG